MTALSFHTQSESPKELPVEVGLHVLSFLDVKSLLQAATVSKAWQELGQSEYLWKKICWLHGWGAKEEGSSWRDWAIEQVRSGIKLKNCNFLEVTPSGSVIATVIPDQQSEALGNLKKFWSSLKPKNLYDVEFISDDRMSILITDLTNNDTFDVSLPQQIQQIEITADLLIVIDCRQIIHLMELANRKWLCRFNLPLMPISYFPRQKLCTLLANTSYVVTCQMVSQSFTQGRMQEIILVHVFFAGRTSKHFRFELEAIELKFATLKEHILVCEIVTKSSSGLESVRYFIDLKNRVHYQCKTENSTNVALWQEGLLFILSKSPNNSTFTLEKWAFSEPYEASKLIRSPINLMLVESMRGNCSIA